MSTLNPTHDTQLVTRVNTGERTAPEQKRRGPPVLMYDCVTPVAGTTLLHALWRRWDEEQKSDQS